MAGLRDAERTVSSPAEESPCLVDIICFQHTRPWKSKTFLAICHKRRLSRFWNPTSQARKPRFAASSSSLWLQTISRVARIAHLGEQRVIESIRRMSIDGLSYRKICDFLTSVGVPTKNRGKGWQPEMIR